MLIMWMRSVLVAGILFFSEAYNVYAMLPESNDWDKVTSTKVPRGRQQLEIYKDIYGKHIQTQGENPGIFTSQVDGLELPFSWLYANAYQRLKEVEEENPREIIETLGQAPLAALQQLYNDHVQDRSTPLSISRFKNSVIDVVELLDLYFHFFDEEAQRYIRKKSLSDIFSKKNTGTSESCFSPVFLQKQGISISSINYAFFGKGPLLAVVEVGPNRHAHNHLLSQTNRRFIYNHDLLHAGDTQRVLQKKHPTLFRALRLFHDQIETLPEEKIAQRDLLQMGLFLLGREYVTAIFDRYIIPSHDSILEDALKTGLQSMITKLYCEFHKDERSYIVLHKDSFNGIAKAMERYVPQETEKEVYKNIQDTFKPENRTLLSEQSLGTFLNEFKERFIEIATPLIALVDQELSPTLN